MARHLLELGRVARRVLAVAALIVTGVWLSGALSLDAFLEQLAAGWRLSAAPPHAAPRPLRLAVRPVSALAFVASGIARSLRSGAAAHLRVARRADNWLLALAARASMPGS